MSDERKEGWNNNEGVTLPDEDNATHNVGLTPLFVVRSGSTGSSGATFIFSRGASGAWRSSIAYRAGWAYFAAFNRNWPSQRASSAFDFSLRCLVSTTNS